MQLSSKTGVFLALAVLLFLLGVQPSAKGETVSSLRQRLNVTSRQMNAVRKSLRQTKEQQQNAARQLAVAEHRLAITRDSLLDVRAQLRDTRNKLAATRVQLSRIEKRLKERNDLLAARLTDTYKHGSISYLSVLLGAVDFWDLITRGFMVRKVLDSDVELIEEIKKDKEAVEQLKVSLEEQERARTQLERKHTALAQTAHQQTQERQRILKDIQKDRVKLEQMLAALEADSRSIGSMIRKMQSTAAGRKRLSQRWTGKFMMPVSGRITSGFGMRYHPILKTRRMHTGVDIAAPHGTTIRAAAGGYVLYTGWRSALGNTVIIDHGGGVCTIYGHCSGFLVSAGTTVRQGQAIAKIGSTGLSTGPHVHFEVQKNGQPVSPF